MIIELIVLSVILLLTAIVCLLENKEIKVQKEEIDVLKDIYDQTNMEVVNVLDKWELTIDHMKQMMESNARLVEENDILKSELKELNGHESD